MQDDFINRKSPREESFGRVRSYVVILVLGFVTFLVLYLKIILKGFAVGAFDYRALGLAILASLLLVIAEIYFFIFFYRAWRFAIVACQSNGLEPRVRAPGRAVGFAFIPVFNLYWHFIAFGKLPTTLSAVASVMKVKTMAPEWIGTALAAVFLLAVFPVIRNLAVFIAGLILQPICILKSIDFCRNLTSQTSDPSGCGSQT